MKVLPEQGHEWGYTVYGEFPWQTVIILASIKPWFPAIRFFLPETAKRPWVPNAFVIAQFAVTYLSMEPEWCSHTFATPTRYHSDSFFRWKKNLRKTHPSQWTLKDSNNHFSVFDVTQVIRHFKCFHSCSIRSTVYRNNAQLTPKTDRSRCASMFRMSETQNLWWNWKRFPKIDAHDGAFWLKAHHWPSDYNRNNETDKNRMAEVEEKTERERE